MAYGTVKVDNITFTNGGSDQTITVSGIVQSISGNITATGTLQGATIIGTSTVSGATVTGNAGQFTTATAATGIFTTQISGATITGTVGQFTTLTGSSAGFTTVTGATVTGTTANFSSGVFTTQISGATVTGNVGSFTTITGGTVTLTSGVIASGTAANPSLSIVGDSNTGLYSPGADQLAISTGGTGRLFVDASGRVGIGTASPQTLFSVSTSASAPAFELNPDLSSSTTLTAFDRGVGNTWYDMRFCAKELIFSPVGIEKVRIDSSGRLLVGTSSALSVGSPTAASFQSVNTASAPNIAMANFVNASAGSFIILGASRGTSVGSYTAVANNDRLGTIRFAAADGTDLQSLAAAIECYAEADAASNDTPGRLVFSSTAAGASAPTERLRISANGLHTINSQAHSGAALSTTAPAKLYISTGTYTDTSTAASGTVTHGTITAFDNPAIAATNATVTYTNASTVYIDGAPTGGSNVTVTNGFALYVNAGRCHFGGSVLSASPTDGLGYKTGAGGTVTQTTSRTTGVTINKICGAITLVSAAGSTSYQSFTVTNSTVAATDTIIVNQKSGTDLYEVFVTAVAAGSFRITFATTGGTTTEQPVFNFSVIKAVTA